MEWSIWLLGGIGIATVALVCVATVIERIIWAMEDYNGEGACPWGQDASMACQQREVQGE